MTGVTSSDAKQRTWRIPAKALEATIAKAVNARQDELALKANDQSIARHELTELDAATALDLVRQVCISSGALAISLCSEQLVALLGTEYRIDQDDLKISLPFTERQARR